MSADQNTSKRTTLVFTKIAPCDWPEALTHENGAYQNTCLECGGVFIGHKRRVICRTCATPAEGGSIRG